MTRNCKVFFSQETGSGSKSDLRLYYVKKFEVWEEVRRQSIIISRRRRFTERSKTRGDFLQRNYSTWRMDPLFVVVAEKPRSRSRESVIKRLKQLIVSKNQVEKRRSRRRRKKKNEKLNNKETEEAVEQLIIPCILILRRREIIFEGGLLY